MTGNVPTPDQHDGAVPSLFVGLLSASLGVATFGMLDGSSVVAGLGLGLVWASILGFSMLSRRAKQSRDSSQRHRDRVAEMHAYVHSMNDDRERTIALLTRSES